MIQRLIPLARLAMLCSVLFGQQTSNIVGLVQDPSGAAGVTIDLIRMAASALRQRRAGYLTEAAPLLKSPPGTSV